jgi:putative hydroxymethylpyrimidine transport system substrate-binding protein
MKPGRAGVALSLAVFVLAGCGGGNDGETTGASSNEPKQAQPRPDEQRTAKAKPPEPGQTHRQPKKLRSLSFTLEGYPDAENVGVLMADQEGYFAEAGLDVQVLRPADSDNVPIYLAEEADDFGLLPQPQVVMARDKGMPLVAIGSLVARPTMGLIWARGSGIDDLSDLEGKTIGINGFSFEEGFLETLLAQAGLKSDDVKVKSVNYDGLVPALTEGSVDAILGSGNVEGLELEAEGLEPVVTPLQKLGVPAYEELVMVTRRDRLAGHPRWVRRFMAAVARGAAAAVEDPEAAAAAIVAARKELQLTPASMDLAEAKVEASLPLIAGTGRMSARRATHLGEWMHEKKLIQHKLPAAASLTNRYVLPPATPPGA